jgi:L-alanine-DL-glutamate epimerase-like enolase superfamily enzyme
MTLSGEGTAPAAEVTDLGLITGIQTVRWQAQPNVVWVLVTTSAGITGLGETYYLPGAVEAVVHDMAAPLLVGQPAGAIASHAHTLFSCANFSGFAGAEMRAFSAIDLALWDAAGRRLGVPVYQLLGGAFRQTIPLYNTCVSAGRHDDGNMFIDAPADLALQLRDAGFLGMKVWPWDRFAPQVASAAITGPAGWSAMGPVGHYLAPSDLSGGLGVLEAIRSAVGHDLEIIVEGHSRWDLAAALRICRAIEPLDALWIEDVIQPDSADDLARLVAETRVPQAVSERLISRFPFRDVLERRAAHVVMLDLAWTGGLTEGQRIAALADTYHLPFAPHDCTGPVTLLANVHLAAASPNAMVCETVRGFIDGWYTEVLDTPFGVRDGHVGVPDRPGLGAFLSEQFLSRSGVTVRSSS